MDFTNFQKIIELGGWVMYPLLACSLIIWALTFYKMWSFYRVKSQIERIYFDALALLNDHKSPQFQGLSQNADPIVKAPFRALFQENFKSSREKWERSISRELAES